MGSKPETIMHFLEKHLSGRPAIIGISSGIDSALVLMLLSKSLNKEMVHAYFIPDSCATLQDHEDVKRLMQAAGIKIETVPLDSAFNSIVNILPPGKREDYGNLKSRIRMSILYFHANMLGGFVVGTTNLSEYLTGYFTKFGDGGCDLEPIIGLTKTEVGEMAELLGVPDSIVHKPPSAGLWEGQKDEEELGLAYQDIDSAVMEFRFKGRFPDTDAGKKISALYRVSEHKRRLPLTPED